eukprot:Skav236493  [mRNA]  locus=scaffold1440:290732:292186:+ [translate_table: standard]
MNVRYALMATPLTSAGCASDNVELEDAGHCVQNALELIVSIAFPELKDDSHLVSLALGYASLDGLRCDDCDAYCRACIAGSRIACTACYSGYTLKVLDTKTNTGECMQDCPKGFFRDAPNDLRCIQCGKYCMDCNSLYNCFECQAGATLFRGICYLDPTGTVDQTVDLQTYLSSGAGATWDSEDAPSWTLLTSQVRRLEETLNWDPSAWPGTLMSE